MLTHQSDSSCKERAVFAVPGVTVAALWIFTATRFGFTLDFLLPFTVLLCGGGLIATMSLVWARGRASTRETLASGAVGVATIVFAGAELAAGPEGPGAVLRLFLQMLLVVSLVYLVRVQRQEKASRP
jgi:hypothetical protein